MAGASSSLLTYAFRKFWNSTIHSDDLNAAKTGAIVASSTADRRKQIKKELIIISKVGIYGGVLWSTRSFVTQFLMPVRDRSVSTQTSMYVHVLAGSVSGAMERLVAYLCGDTLSFQTMGRLIGRSTLSYALYRWLSSRQVLQHILVSSVVSVGENNGSSTSPTTTREVSHWLGHFLTAAVISIGTHLCCNFASYRSSAHYLNYFNLLREGIAGGIVYTSYEMVLDELKEMKNARITSMSSQ